MATQTHNWFARTLAFVALVTALRIAALALTSADLFVDEAQYWLWGQTMDFGYYSKPPLIAWVIRATTDLAASNSAFWVRLPAPLFHGATALILALWASREFDAKSALWVGVAYVTLPIVGVGSVMISTDTIMAPFYALALLFYSRARHTNTLWHAMLCGGTIGVAFMAKYAGVYFILTAALAMIALPSYRLSLRQTLVLLVAFALVISPNILWNLAHDLTTLDHTLDNASWVRDEKTQLFPAKLAEFFFTQFAVMGPIFFATFLILPFREKSAKIRGLLVLSLPIILLVCVQALLSRAYGNWAFAAYFAGVLAVVPWLAIRYPRWLFAGVAVNIAINLLLMSLTVFADRITVQDEPVMIRFLGRDELSHQILDLATKHAPAAIVSNSRDVLADLFITGHDSGVAIYSSNPKGRAKNYYQQTYPVHQSNEATAIFIARNPPKCGTLIATFETDHTAYQKADFNAYLMGATCYNSIK